MGRPLPDYNDRPVIYMLGGGGCVLLSITFDRAVTDRHTLIMFIVLMLPLDKSFHKVKCYSLTVTQASGTTASNVVRRKKSHGFKSAKFIHLFIYSFN